MHVLFRTALLSACGGLSMLPAAPAPENLITIEVLDGLFAGTYTASDVACLHVKDRNTLGCGWKKFAEQPKSKTLEEAGIQVDMVSSGPGSRNGDVIVKFLDGISNNMHDYSVSKVAMTFTRHGNTQQLSFDGKTKDGVRMRVTGTIVQVDEF